MTRAHLPALGYAYVILTLPALILGNTHPQATAALLTGGGLAYLWFLASLSGQLVRYEPDGFFATVAMLGGGGFFVLQTLAVLSGDTAYSGPAAACSTSVIIGASYAAWRARKIPKWFARAGIAGGVAVAIVGLVEGADNWKLAGHSIFASSLGFFIWVLVTATYLLRR